MYIFHINGYIREGREVGVGYEIKGDKQILNKASKPTLCISISCVNWKWW